MKNYVDNKKLLLEMIRYKDALNNNENPRVPEYVGVAISLMAERLSTKANFINYPFREDMIAEGVENCIMYIHNFDPNKSQNPFAYFTQIIYYAFLRRIQKEKKYLYIKHAATSMAEIQHLTNDSQEHDTRDYAIDSSSSDWSQEQMMEFMNDFEEKQKRKKRKRK